MLDDALERGGEHRARSSILSAGPHAVCDRGAAVHNRDRRPAQPAQRRLVAQLRERADRRRASMVRPSIAAARATAKCGALDCGGARRLDGRSALVTSCGQRVHGGLVPADAQNDRRDPTTINRLYGRSTGHKLRDASKRRWSRRCCPQIAVPAEGELTRARPVRRRPPAPSRDRLRRGRTSRLSRRPAARSRLHRLRAVPQRRRHRAGPCPRPAISPMSGLHMGDALDVLRRLPDGALELRLSAPPRPLAQGAPRQAADDQRRPARPDRRQAEARRRIPHGDRPSGLSRPGADGHAAPPPPVRMAGRGARRIG